MKLDKAARAILGVTALAWTIPLAQAAEARQPGVPVETFDNEVLLSGFVQDAEQKKKALLVASDVEGVKDVNDGLQVRD